MILGTAFGNYSSLSKSRLETRFSGYMSVTKRPVAVQRILPYIFLFVLTLVVFVPVMTVASKRNIDFGIHSKIAEALPQEVTHVSHILYHAVYRLLRYWLPTVDSSEIALLAILVFILPLPMIVFSLTKKHSAGTISIFAIVFLTFGLTIASPITFWANDYMIGYVNSLVYHNPTLFAVRLFVIPVSLLALRIFGNTAYRNANHRLYTLLLCASMILLCTLAKPSYTLVLLPGCCAFAVWQALKGRHIDWILLVFGICLPGVLILGLQYLVSFVNYDDGTSITFGIFEFFRLWIPDWRIPIQLLLSLVFPLTVYLLFFSEARKHIYFNFSWTVFSVSATFTYFLYESGSRIDHSCGIAMSPFSMFASMFLQQYFLSKMLGSKNVPGCLLRCCLRSTSRHTIVRFRRVNAQFSRSYLMHRFD